MIAKTIARFRSFPSELRAVLWSYWVYELAEQLVSIFMGAHLFLETQSIGFLALYFSIYFTACFFGFSIWGYLMAQLRINLKFNHLRAFVLYIVSFLVLFIWKESYFVFAALNGLGLGMFWVGHHAFEIQATNEKNRDFYVGVLVTGSRVVSVLGPLIASLLFMFTEGMSILFMLMPFVYLLGLPFVFRLPSFVPKRISTAAMKRLLFDKKLQPVRRYSYADSLGWPAYEMVIPVIALSALASMENIGIFQTILSVLAIGVSVWQAHAQEPKNRLKVYFWMCVFGALIYASLFFWQLSPAVYIGFGLITIILHAVHQNIGHVYALKTMDLLEPKKGDFYPGMLYRDYLLWLGRVGTTLIIFAVDWAFGNIELTVAVGVALLVLHYLSQYLTARSMVPSKVNLKDEALSGLTQDHGTNH